MTLLARPPKEHDLDAEALIKEARHLRRRRWLIGLSVICLVAMVAGVVIAVATDKASTSLRSPSSVRTVPTPYTTSSTAIALKTPQALAVGPNGNLYIADVGRNQILERLANGRLKVIAGTGTMGYSGDDGPAIDAELDDPSWLTFARNGTIYFVDHGNKRIRAVLPNGKISTVAGDGDGYSSTGISNGTPALQAALSEPTAVAVSPAGELYIATDGQDQVLRLAPNGRLYIVAGPTVQHLSGATGIGGPAVQATPDGPNGLAFDRAGDLYIFGSNSKTLLMIDTSGFMHLLKVGFYPRGAGLITAPDGVVYATDTQDIVQLSPSGEKVIFNLFTAKVLASKGAGFLPDGIAVASNGAIYSDTDLGNGYTDKTALIEIRPGNQIRVLWKAPPVAQ